MDPFQNSESLTFWRSASKAEEQWKDRNSAHLLGIRRVAHLCL